MATNVFKRLQGERKERGKEEPIQTRFDVSLKFSRQFDRNIDHQEIRTKMLRDTYKGEFAQSGKQQQSYVTKDKDYEGDEGSDEAGDANVEDPFAKENAFDMGDEDEDQSRSPGKRNSTPMFNKSLDEQDEVKDYFHSQSMSKTKPQAPRVLSINDPLKTKWDLFS